MRNIFLQIRINEIEKKSFKDNANSLNLSMTSYFRLLNTEFSINRNKLDKLKEDENN